jgi:hypothetical protein
MAYHLYITRETAPTADELAGKPNAARDIWTFQGTWTCTAHVEIAQNLAGYRVDCPTYWLIIAVDPHNDFTTTTRHGAYSGLRGRSNG